MRSFAARGEELRENDYPISGDGHLAATYLPAALPMDGLDASAVKASPGVGAAADAATRLLAIDCEMVLVRGTTMVDGPLVKQLARGCERRAARSSTSSSSPSDQRRLPYGYSGMSASSSRRLRSHSTRCAAGCAS